MLAPHPDCLKDSIIDVVFLLFKERGVLSKMCFIPTLINKENRLLQGRFLFGSGFCIHILLSPSTYSSRNKWFPSKMT